jgi:hypothetical protein
LEAVRRGRHEQKRGVDGGRADLDRDDRVQQADGGLERREVVVLVGEDAEDAGVDAEADTAVDVLLGRLEPSVGLRLLVDEVQERIVAARREVPVSRELRWQERRWLTYRSPWLRV